jgi:hypothetical protein
VIRRLTSLTPVLLTVSALAMLVLVLTVPAAGSAAAPAVTPSAGWRCIAGICLGHNRASLDYRFGWAGRDIPSRTLRVRGGRVRACFWRCFNAVTEDGFTYYGGNRRPANRLLTVGTCSPIIRLPDGVTIGTAIPFGRRWRGYRRMTRYIEGGSFGWERIVWYRGTRTKVLLTMSRGRVQCIDLEQPR